MQLLEVTWWELIALIGLAQTVMLIVYIAFRSGKFSHAAIAVTCFMALSAGFLADFGTRYLSELSVYPFLRDAIWYSLPVLFVLLVVQIAKIDGLPEKRYWFSFLLIPVMIGAGWFSGMFHDGCSWREVCNIEGRREILAIAGVILGGVSLLSLWARRDLLDRLVQEKSLKSERYWLILTLILMNCALIALSLSFVSGALAEDRVLIIRNLLGCGLVYVASTSLLRIYPQTLKLMQKSSSQFNDEEVVLAKKLEDLLHLQKVYQEPSYSRTDLARELMISESVVSKIVNLHFGKSVPQLLNERRVEDAKRLLTETDAPISVIADEVGFSSLPSFNRVFKELTGKSPTEFRSRQQGERKALA